jgi:hypothetical protein
MAELPYVYTSGMNNAAEFSASGWPFTQYVATTGSVNFPWVTNEIYVINTGSGTAYIGFTAPGITSSYKIPILSNTTQTFRWKLATLFVSSSTGLTVAAALTNITPQQYPYLSQSSRVIHDLSDDNLRKLYPGI